MTTINIPPTLGARFDPDPWTSDWYDHNGQGTVVLTFGGYEFHSVRIECDGERFMDDGSFGGSQRAAEEYLSEFVAELLGKFFNERG